MPITLLNNNNNMQSRYTGIFSFSANPWWLPSGILPSNVIAAYQFKGVPSEADALLNLKDSSAYPLTKVGSPTWNQATGVSIPASGGVGYNNASIVSFISAFARFSDAQTGNVDISLISPAANYCLAAKISHVTNDSTHTYKLTPGFRTSNTYTYYSAAEYASGVLGWDVSGGLLYLNGANISTTLYNQGAYSSTNNTYILIGNDSRYRYVGVTKGSVKIQAVAFYNTQLSVAQVIELSTTMAAL